MNRIHIENLDLNLLTVLRTVHSEGSVTDAAARLHLTQSAVSHALRRLRAALGDPLFVRHGTALVATSFTKNLAGPLHSALSTLEEAVNSAARFDPARSSRRFTVGMDERLEVFALPPFVERLLANAPGIEFRSVRIDADSLETQLATGLMDAAVSAGAFSSPELERVAVARDSLSVLARRGHPLVSEGTLTLEKYLAAEHVVVTAQAGPTSEEDIALSRAGLARRIRVRTQRYVAAVTIVSRSDLLLTMPRLYVPVVNAAAKNNLCPLPIQIPLMEYFLYWHPSTNTDAGGRWLREEIIRSFAVHSAQEIETPSPSRQSKRKRAP